MFELIDRPECVVTGNTNFEILPSPSPFPYFMGCTNAPQENDILVEMQWAIEKKTGMIQLLKLIPEEILYEKSHGSGEIGKKWENHHNTFSKFIKTMSPKNILEIGGGHGRLANIFLQDSSSNWTIIEPNPQPSSNTRIKNIKGFFNKDFKISDYFDAIIHSHTLEHIYYPMEFMENVSSYLKEGDLHIFSIPNLEQMLIQNYTNCLDFEHTTFITEPYVDFMLSKNKFKIIKKEYFLEDHSIFYACIKDSNVTELKLEDNLYKKNKKIYLNFINYYNNFISDMNKVIDSSTSNVYLFGAHVFSQFLIIVGINFKKITCIIDNDPNKQGKRLYGTSLQVKSPFILAKEIKPVIILKAGQYNEEIKEQIFREINREAIFYE